ncbi:MAG: hypothetical protein NZ601_01885, partial [candidate division WOR-3 bacterium]|nr:hypothetical protein [candidate division WOR-3 bacterium]MDW7988329.1 hypothetical protein [candidate division WOR-3 bacterium]
IGTIFKITIIPKEDYSEIQKKVLWATIWTWANLGAIGQRARRGFGSVVITNVITNNTVEFPSTLLNTPEFNSRDQLIDHLTNGFNEVQDIFINWLGSGNAQKKLDVPQDARYFILQSPNQIKVANNSFKDLATALNKVHGSNRCDCLGWAKGDNKMASPVFTRFHKIKNDYIPIFTYCRQKVRIDDAYYYIPSDECLKAYFNLNDVICNPDCQVCNRSRRRR